MIERQKKIVHIISRLNVGGVSVHVIQLCAYLDTRQYESHILAGQIESYEADMSYLATELGVKPIMINSMQRSLSPGKDIKSIQMIYRYLKKEKPDIVVTHTSKAGTIGRIAAILAKVPVIIHTFHGNIFNGYFGKLKTWFFLIIERILSQKTDAIIVLAQQQKRELVALRLTNKEKIEIVNLGFDFSKIIPKENSISTLRDELNIPKNAPVFGIIGRLTSIKNHEMFFEIAREVAHNHPEVHFIVVGDGELRQYLEKISKNNDLAGIVHFTGFRKDLQNIYAALDIVLLTSRNEGTPVALIEAMACRKVVMSTKVGGVEDFIQNGKNGFYFSGNEVSAFVQEIENWLENPDSCLQLQDAAYETAINLFSLDKLLSQTDNLFKRLLEQKGK